MILKKYPKINDPEVVSIDVSDCEERLSNIMDIDRIFLYSKTKVKSSAVNGDCEPIVRETVKKKIKKLISLLDKKYGLLIIQGYRKYDYQKLLFQKEVSKIIKKRKLSISKAEMVASQFVSNPDIYSPHVTGGAVDLGIIDLSTMDLLDMGNNFIYDDTARFNCPNLNKSQKLNRTMLSDLMSQIGFVNYPYEWWHWSYGDKYWAYINRKSHAIYESVI